jgi:hypothetical protein
MVVGALVSAGAPAANSTVFDRAFACSIPVHAGVRDLEVHASSGVRAADEPSRWSSLSQAALVTGSSTVGTIASMQAGAPLPELAARPTVWIFTRHCRPSSASVRLSASGLSGGPANQIPERFECPVPRTVLVRVRVELRSSASLRLRDGGLSTQMPVRAGKISARTLTGKPLAYAEVFESGKARLFFAGNCLRA